MAERPTKRTAMVVARAIPQPGHVRQTVDSGDWLVRGKRGGERNNVLLFFSSFV